MPNDITSPVTFELSPQQKSANQAANYFRLSAKIAGIYFVVRFLAAFLTNSIFVVALGFNFFQYPNVLLPISVGFFLWGLDAAVGLEQVADNASIRGAFKVGSLGAVCLLVLSTIFAVVSIFFPAADTNAQWLIWFDVFTFALWLLGGVALVGIGYFIYSLYVHGRLKPSSCLLMAIGLGTIMLNFLTLFSFAYDLIFPITFFLLAGVCWYLGAMQLTAWLETGRDQPIAAE